MDLERLSETGLMDMRARKNHCNLVWPAAEHRAALPTAINPGSCKRFIF